MFWQALLLTQDAAAQRLLLRAAETASLQVDTLTAATAVTGRLSHEKIDAVIVDCDVNGALNLIDDIRSSRSNQKAVVFAVLSRKTTMREAFDVGASFILEKPVNPERAQRTLRAAQGFILRERRRYLRHPVNAPVLLVTRGAKEHISAEIHNVSEGGLSMSLDRSLGAERLQMCFQLPQAKTAIFAKGEVVWHDHSGRVGMRFVGFGRDGQAVLDSWLQERTTGDGMRIAVSGVQHARRASA